MPIKMPLERIYLQNLRLFFASNNQFMRDDNEWLLSKLIYFAEKSLYLSSIFVLVQTCKPSWIMTWNSISILVIVNFYVIWSYTKTILCNGKCKTALLLIQNAGSFEKHQPVVNDIMPQNYALITIAVFEILTINLHIFQLNFESSSNLLLNFFLLPFGMRHFWRNELHCKFENFDFTK